MSTIGYCVSRSENQINNGHSLSIQKEVVNKEIERHGITDAVIYEDQHLSETLDDSEIYQSLKKTIKDGKVQNLFLYSISRLSRNLRETIDFIEMCESNGVRVISVWERYDTNLPSTKFTLYVLGGFAENQNSETI